MDEDVHRFDRRTILRASFGAASAAGALTVLAACSDSGGTTTSATMTPATDPPTGPASADDMLGWIEEIVDQGIRRPAYPADEWIEEWARARFEAYGLEDARLESVDVTRWTPGRAELTVEPDGPTFTGFALPHTEAGTVDGVLTVLPDDPAAGSLSGRIVVSELDPIVLPQTLARSLATSHYDPDGDFETLEQILPFDTRFNGVLDPAVDAGAAGFVGLLTGFPWETTDYYVPYDGTERPITGLWLSAADGRALLDLLAAGDVRVRIHVEAESAPATSHNVVGTLPGASDDWVIVASHHDGPWASAVEDASGVSLVVAQAAHWASVPVDERPHNLMFVITAGHMFGGAGTAAFVAEHRDLLDRVVLEVHLEHAARQCVGRDGELVPTDDPEVRWWFTSRNPDLERDVLVAIGDHDLRRSLVMKPDVFFETPPTDGAAFHAAGVPVVHFLTAPMYLFDSRDTLDKIHEATLEPLTDAVVQIISSTAGITPAQMRAGIVEH